MRLVFAGTPEFAEQALARLLDAGHEVALVLTQPDRGAGRGLRPAASAVKRLAVLRGLELYQPDSLKSPKLMPRLCAARPELLVVAAYGLLLPQPVLEVAPLGAINIHASLLPRWRGAAPIQRALLAGDQETGISIMQMESGLDTGAVLLQQRLPIDESDDAGSLHDKLAALGADAVVSVLTELQAGRARATPQPPEGVTYARKVDKQETWIDWSRPAVELERAVRAFRPVPGAGVQAAGGPLKLWRVRVLPGQAGAPGTVLEAQKTIVVACGEGALEILELQRPGGRRIAAADYIRGQRLRRGAALA